MAFLGLGMIKSAKLALDKVGIAVELADCRVAAVFVSVQGAALAPGDDFSAALEVMITTRVLFPFISWKTGGMSQSLEKMGVESVSEADAASETVDAGLVEEEDKFDTVNKWLIDNGAEFPLLYMKRYSENYRGVHIRSTVPVIPCCSVRLRLPRSQWLCDLVSFVRGKLRLWRSHLRV